jgi:flagellar hook-associated protein FlgK
MSDLVSIAGTAAAAYQRALGVVSNNIANVGSAGYSRQEADLIESAPRAFGTSYLGTGVNFAGVRRAYDEFIESTLRNATTDLSSQEPMVNYANRVVNILGSEDVGLLSAFDEFFDSARQLSTDSSSLILRSQFLSKSEGLTERFQTLSGQLGLVTQESQEAINTDIAKLNNLSKQLATINGQLMKTKFKDRQPPALMDQRDQTLRDMAELTKLNVKEAPNGVMTVSIGSSLSRGLIVDGTDSRKLTALFNESDVGRVDLVINPGMPSFENIVGFSGGSIAGLIGFRSQLLEPVFNDLDNLAKTLVQEVNAIHQEGIDLEGRNGEALFKVDPQFAVVSGSGDTAARVDASLFDLQAFEANTINLEYRANVGQINDLSLTGDFAVGDQITVTLNSLSKTLTLSGKVDDGAALAEGTVLSLSQVKQQLRNFLEGGQRLSPEELVDYFRTGNQTSLDGAFGRQLTVDFGAQDDLLISSDVLGAYNLNLTVYSRTGAGLDNRVTRGQWQATDERTGQMVTGTRSLEMNGIRLNFSGEPKDGELLSLKVRNSAAAGIRLNTDDPTKVASAARFRVIENQFNPTGADAKLFEAPQAFPDEEAIALNRVVADDGQTLLDNNVLEDVAVDFDRVRVAPITVIPAGYSDTTLYLGELNGEPIDLQVLTRDGRHLLGRQMADARILEREIELGRPLTEQERALEIDQAGEDFLANAKLADVAFAEGSSYSAQYLNASDDEAYRGMELFYGVKAKVTNSPELTLDHVYDSRDTVALRPAELLSGVIQSFEVSLEELVYAEGDLVMNDRSLGSLRVTQVSNGAGGLTPMLVTDITQTDGRVMTKAIPYPVVTANTSGKYEITAEHLQFYFAAQDGFGAGEKQALQFAPAAQDGSFTIAGETVNVSVGDTAVTIAQRVAEALNASDFIQNFGGRYAQAFDDGSVVIQFALTDSNVDRVSLTSSNVELTATVIEDVLREGPWALGEERTLTFAVPSTAGTISIAGVTIALDPTVQTTAALVATKVHDALMAAGSAFVSVYSERRAIDNGDGTLTLRFPASEGDPVSFTLFDSDALGVVNQNLTNTTREFSGLEIKLNESDTDGNLATTEEYRLSFHQPIVEDSDRPQDSEIRIGLGRAGLTTDLAKLGFRTGVYVSGEVKEDLIVFSTLTHTPDASDPDVRPDLGVGFTLGAIYKEGTRDPVETLRAEPFDVVFTSSTSYNIIDRTTNTLVAERSYDQDQGVSYRGVTLFLNTTPAAGDQFAVDGNQDGIGNNANMLRIANLQTAAIVGGAGGFSLADAYGQVVTDVGNASFQASIAQKALEVVKDQAVQARDKISGVSLDEEAADLIRYQQAYQANAKVMQTASTLFDAILAVR